MKKYGFILLMILFHCSAFAQLVEDFSDGDFTTNPVWSGDTSKFKVNTNSTLQLNNSGVDTAILSTSNALTQNAIWSFYMKQSFNSSANNYSRVYLMSNKADFKTDLKAYFIQFGSSDDDICLYRQDSMQLVKIIDGVDGRTSNSTNTFNIKVEHNLQGKWTLWLDEGATQNYIKEGEVTDTTYQSSQFFGLFCRHTSSNSTKVYFDDIRVENIQIDSIPPKIQSLEILSADSLKIVFDEAVLDSTAKIPSNYLINNGIGQPSQLVLNPLAPAEVVLILNPMLQSGNNYQISAQNIMDLKMNKANTLTYSFDFYAHKIYDIVINEIMADPNPTVGLPDVEYLELYNRSNFDISLKDWTLYRDNTAMPFPDVMIPSHAYAIVCDENDVQQMSSYGTTIGITSFSLKNSGQLLNLEDADGNSIHHIEYNSFWYGQSSKADGGWSMEQIDFNNPCGEVSNWWASNAAAGGSPGAQNSIYAQNPDLQAPKIQRISVLDSLHMEIHLSETMNMNKLQATTSFEINNGIGFPYYVGINPPYNNRLVFTLSNPLQKKQTYLLIIRDTLRDCIGNPMLVNSNFRFGIAESPQPGDLVINEVLFNPKDDGVDYVEIYNRSDKILEIKDMQLANYDESLQDFKDVEWMSLNAYALYPGEYYVFCENSEMVQKQYFVRKPDNIIVMDALPSMNNDAGNIYLMDKSRMVFDSLYYDESMHFALLTSTEGVSLERINYDEANTPQNWKSAAETFGFGTPTAQNSQFLLQNTPQVQFDVSPEIFSPDNDGYHDMCEVHYKLDAGLLISRALVFDAQGRLIQEIANMESAGTEGVIRWDGTTLKNQKAPMGIYVILIEIIDIQGNKSTHKVKATLGGRL